MADNDTETRVLIERAAAGDEGATRQLLDRHRDRLEQMVHYRMDPLLAQRVDPGDVVQDAFLVAIRKLPEYAREMPIGLYPWLRQIVLEQMTHAQVRHLYTAKRSAARELNLSTAFSDHSREVLAQNLITFSTPSKGLMAAEQRDRVFWALDQLPSDRRELLVQRFLEQLAFSEIADVLKISEAAAKMRVMRALERVRELLETRGE